MKLVEELLWKVIEESKSGEVYLSSKKQYTNLGQILSGYEQNTIKSIHEAWVEKSKLYTHENVEFEKLHEQNGGIVSAGDDGFYMDFANWLLAQGQDLYKKFQKEGHQAVIDYIEENHISENDYLFECMSYVFHKYLK